MRAVVAYSYNSHGTKKINIIIIVTLVFFWVATQHFSNEIIYRQALIPAHIQHDTEYPRVIFGGKHHLDEKKKNLQNVPSNTAIMLQGAAGCMQQETSQCTVKLQGLLQLIPPTSGLRGI